MTFASILERGLGSRPRDATSAPSAGVVELCDGRRVFVKAPRDARVRAMIDAEEHGLAFLRDRSALRVPSLLFRGDDFLVLEALELRPLDGASAERFGHALAELHRSGAPSFGLDRDNFVELTELRNTPHPRRCDFYRNEPILAVARR